MTLTLDPVAPPWTLRFFSAAPALTALALMIALAAFPLMVAMGLDPRQFQGDSIWLKPLKFHAALVIYVGTLAVFARYLPDGMLQSPGWRVYQAVVIACILAELFWIGGAAALGTASHFNTGSPVWAAIYGLMGVAAVTLTSMTLVMGLAIWRNPTSGLSPAMQLGLALGLILTFALTVIVAGKLASGTGHLVGTPVTGARVPLMGWSREVGDLRLPHFLATHAMHVVPLAGFTGQKAVVWIAALGYLALVAATFAQALAGRPAF